MGPLGTIPPNPWTFQHRCHLRRHRTVEDAPGSIRRTPDDYPTTDFDVPCKFGWASDESVPGLQTMDRRIDVTVSFPTDVRLRPGDIVIELDRTGTETGRSLLVERYRKVGLVHLARWVADGTMVQ